MERIWNFKGKNKTLNSMYNALSKVRHSAHGRYGKIRYTYFGAVAEHKELGRVKLVFLHTGKDLIVFISTDLALSADDIITTYKKRWNIEQGYKDLREHFGLGKEENRLYEALIAKITLSMFAYNITSYINRISNEPKTLGELFRELECELEALVISMQLFIQILSNIAVLRVYTQKELGFMCEN